MKLRLCALAFGVSLLTPALFPVSAFASTVEDRNRLIFYGVGIGFGSLMCDFVENSLIDKTTAEIAISNMRTEMKTDASYTEYKLGPIRRQAVKDGFNAAVKEMSSCRLKF